MFCLVMLLLLNFHSFAICDSFSCFIGLANDSQTTN